MRFVDALCAQHGGQFCCHIEPSHRGRFPFCGQLPDGAFPALAGDAGALYASFRQQYGIDLLRQPLHWFEFRELLAGLTEQTAFGARVRLRMADENAAPPEERAHLRRLKEQVALRPRVGKAEQTLLRELDRRLAAGESPDTVLRQLTDREG